MTQQWEYKTSHGNDRQIEEILVVSGEAGWELVSVVKGAYWNLFFKRPKDNKPTDAFGSELA
jgi:hypothetical protein